MEDESFSSLGKWKRESGLWIKQHVFYVVVFLASFIVLLFFPMIGSSVSGWMFEKFTASDWVFYVGTRVLVSILNFIIYASFCKQGEYNVRSSAKYQKAMEILGRNKPKDYKPLSPAKWKRKQYISKGITLTISSIGTLFIFTDVILHYDWICLLSYAITIIMAIIFGLIEMTVSEDYWSNTFYEYAIPQHCLCPEDFSGLRRPVQAPLPAIEPAPDGL